jgi:hypothetical protein
MKFPSTELLGGGGDDETRCAKLPNRPTRLMTTANNNNSPHKKKAPTRGELKVLAMNTYHKLANAGDRISDDKRDLRAEFALLQARSDGGAVSPALYATIRAIGPELSWLEHRGRP